MKDTGLVKILLTFNNQLFIFIWQGILSIAFPEESNFLRGSHELKAAPFITLTDGTGPIQWSHWNWFSESDMLDSNEKHDRVFILQPEMEGTLIAVYKQTFKRKWEDAYLLKPQALLDSLIASIQKGAGSK
jgi:hypothetical protein